MARRVTISPISDFDAQQPLHRLLTRRMPAMKASPLPSPISEYCAQRASSPVADKDQFASGGMISAMPSSRNGFTK